MKDAAQLGKRAIAESDEMALWDVMQQEEGSPVGLTLWLVWQMGLSVADVLALTWEQVDVDAKSVCLQDREVPTGKIIARILRQVKEMRAPDADPHVLLSPTTQKPYDAEGLSAQVKTALVRAGIERTTMDVLLD